jgi:hypothetical protein
MTAAWLSPPKNLNTLSKNPASARGGRIIMTDKKMVENNTSVRAHKTMPRIENGLCTVFFMPPSGGW